MGAREAFLDPRRIPGEDVEVPEQSARVFVASIGAKLRGELIGALAGIDSDASRTAAIFARMPEILIDSLRDPDTRLRIFEPGDAGKLADLDPVVALRLTLLALRLSGLHAEAAEDAAKNSDSIPS